MKKTAIFLAAAMLLLSLTACEKDEKNSGLATESASNSESVDANKENSKSETAAEKESESLTEEGNVEIAQDGTDSAFKSDDVHYGTYAMGSFKLLYMGEDSIYMIDSDGGGNYMIDGSPEWNGDTLTLIIDMMTEEYEYYAEYYLEFSGDTLTFTHLYDRVDLVEIGDSGVYTKTAEDPAIAKENEY